MIEVAGDGTGFCRGISRNRATMMVSLFTTRTVSLRLTIFGVAALVLAEATDRLGPSGRP
jgi:hypothetical protein